MTRPQKTLKEMLDLFAEAVGILVARGMKIPQPPITEKERNRQLGPEDDPQNLRPNAQNSFSEFCGLAAHDPPAARAGITPRCLRGWLKSGKDASPGLHHEFFLDARRAEVELCPASF
jgi:hypothetical protein